MTHRVALSNQVYIEAYTCPYVRYHPFEQTFIAQSNANLIAIFSAKSPFKMDKYKRYEGHQVGRNDIHLRVALGVFCRVFFLWHSHARK
ncbi:unnamed protein product [Calypogeia fissa]